MSLHLLRVFFVPSAVKHFGILHDISLCGECSNRFDKNVISSGFLKRINPDWDDIIFSEFRSIRNEFRNAAPTNE